MGKKKTTDPSIKIVARNKRARHDYELDQRFEAGLVLTGTEVKSLRLGKANLTDSYAKIEDGEAWLVNCHISPYPFAHYDNHDPDRKRKLLLNRKEIDKLQSKTKERGMALIPLALYFKKGRAKVELALARGKRAHDKRQAIKEREQSREMERAIRHRIYD